MAQPGAPHPGIPSEEGLHPPGPEGLRPPRGPGCCVWIRKESRLDKVMGKQRLVLQHPASLQEETPGLPLSPCPHALHFSLRNLHSGLVSPVQGHRSQDQDQRHF